MPAYMGQPTSINSMVTVTPDDDAFIETTKGMRYEGLGDIVVVFDRDEAPVTITIDTTGEYPHRVKKVLSTGTTITANIFALY